MEQFINIIVRSILDNFDFAYMLAINICTYLLIKVIDAANGDKKVNVWTKRVCLLISIIVLTIIYIIVGYDNKIILVNSAILSPVFWSWVLKPICKWFKIDYKQIDETLQ